jgi:TolB-like protein/DNA-binding winged helix-turn-helix (wHTH) protein
MQKTPHKVYSFGDFTLDLTRGCLLRQGGEVKLRPKAFEVLKYLVENSGRLVTKEELHQAAWPDTFVTDDAIVKRLKDLRLALQDDSQQYIKTVPRRGYLFAAEVQEEGSSASGALYAQQVDGIKALIQGELEGESQDTIEAGAGDCLAAAPHRSWRSSLTAVAIPVALVALASLISYLWISSKSSETGISATVESIAVLPFKPLDASSQDESFETGMADTLITRLSGLRQIVVRPISAVRKYTKLEQDPVAAGRELKVDTVLDGSVQRSSERVRVTVRLIRVADGLPIWAGRFDEKFMDIFAVQDTIAEKVVGALAIELTSEERRLFARRHTDNTEAYQAYTKGRYYWNKHTEEGARKSIEYYQQAIEKDPNYALPYVGLADTHTLLGLYYLPSKEAMPKPRHTRKKH